MNREIKFRAWDGGKMLFSQNSDFYLMPNGIQVPSSTGHQFYDKNYHVMQYTGLKDKNGKEIYEGDILISNFGDGLPTQLCFGEFTCATYETKDLATQIGFYWHELDGTKIIFGKSVDGNMEYCEIIGNIYENPELLNP